MTRTKTGVLPGFGLSMGYTLTYLRLVVLIPFAALVLRSMGLTWGEFFATVTDPSLVASYRLIFLASLASFSALSASMDLERVVRPARWASSAESSIAAGSS